MMLLKDPEDIYQADSFVSCKNYIQGWELTFRFTFKPLSVNDSYTYRNS